jgi:DNA-binding CsgD family transcriptional regulator
VEDSPSKVKARGVLARETQGDTDLSHLLQHITAQLGEGLASDNSSYDTDPKQEVVLDVEVNGARYILTRSNGRASGMQVKLSARETEIVRLVSKGLSNKVIAAVLDISPWTVATHLRRIFSKLGVSTRAEMVARVSDVFLEGKQ